MNKLRVIIENKAGQVQYDRLHTGPASWAEITREHLMLWAGTLQSKRTFADAKVILAAMLFNIPKYLFICIGEADREVLAKAVDFLFVKNELNNWLIPSVWCGLFKYYSPKNRLANITVSEFDKCELCYEQFDRTKNPEYLDTLAAILYRPARFWGIDNDIRVKLTTYGYVKRAKRFKKLPIALKTAIYLNYEGCRNFLHKKYKGVFEKSGAAGTAGPVQLTPWPKIIESGSNDIFGPHEPTKSTMVHDFLSRLETRIKEMKDLEAKN